MKADINLIDFNRLDLNHPEIVNDPPAGMPRLMQTATGYVGTFVSGEAVRRTGVRLARAREKPCAGPLEQPRQSQKGSVISPSIFVSATFSE